MKGEDLSILVTAAFYANCDPFTEYLTSPHTSQIDDFDVLKFGIKQVYNFPKRPYTEAPGFSTADLEQTETTRYAAIVKNEEGTFSWVGEPTRIQARYLKKYIDRREARIMAEAAIATTHEKLEKLRGVVYKSRTFPSSLRAIIFERDNYTCQRCGRNLETLKQLHLRLECDHIVAYSDGGITTYDNGETLCSECNNAKHASKHYRRALQELRLLEKTAQP